MACCLQSSSPVFEAAHVDDSCDLLEHTTIVYVERIQINLRMLLYVCPNLKKKKKKMARFLIGES